MLQNSGICKNGEIYVYQHCKRELIKRKVNTIFNFKGANEGILRLGIELDSHSVWRTVHISK